MIRDAIASQVDHDPDFEWRGESVTRIENLSDIVFALALGMLVSSSQPPVSYSQLLNFLPSIVPVSAAFVVLLSIWHSHFTFFRRYGVGDGKTIFLNAILLFLVLFLAYPLRYVFDSLFAFILAQFGYLERAIAIEAHGRNATGIMGIYALGYGATQLILFLMFRHAFSKASALGLSAREVILSKKSAHGLLTQVVLSLGVIIGTLMTPFGPFSGFFWFLAWPASIGINKLANKRLKRLEK